MKPLALALLVSLVVCSSVSAAAGRRMDSPLQSARAEAPATIANGGDDERVAQAFAFLTECRPDRAIASLCAPYTEALAAGDKKRAARYLLLMAFAFRIDENMDGCLACCRMALRLDPSSLVAQTSVADGLTHLGKLLEAEKQLAPLMTLAEKNELVARTVASLYASQSHFGKAQKYLEIARKLNPDDPRVYTGLARLNLSEQSAEELYRQAADRTPSAYLREMYLAASSSAAKQPQASEQHLLQASRLAPDDPSWRVAMAWRKFAHNQNEAGYRFLQEAVACRRNDLRAITAMLSFAQFTGRTQVTNQALKELQRLLPDSPAYYSEAGIVAAMRHDDAEMKRDFAKVLEANPQQPDAYKRLAQTLPDGSEMQNRMIVRWQSACPYDAQAWIFQADRLRHQKQWQPALAAYLHARELLNYSEQCKDRRRETWCALSAGAGTCYYKLSDQDKSLVEKAQEYATIFNALKPDYKTHVANVMVRPDRIGWEVLQGKQHESAIHGVLADMLYETGEFDDSAFEYKEAISRSDNIAWHCGLLSAYMSKNDYAAASKEDLIVANHAVTKIIPEAVGNAGKPVR